MTDKPDSPRPAAKKLPAEKKTSSFYMKKMRAGLADAGYVKHEAWVLPENRGLLKQVEKQLRQPVMAGTFKLEEHMTTAEKWTLDRLHQAFQALDEVASKEITLTLVQGAEQSLKLEMNEYGGLPIHIAVVGEQIIVDTVLVDVDSIKDLAHFNEAVLRSRELFPLSSIGLEQMPNGQTVYNMFGALSASSSLTNVVTEVFTLVDNVQRAAEAFQGFFK
ncbi:YjfI family protein [Pseudomonas putida]